MCINITSWLAKILLVHKKSHAYLYAHAHIRLDTVRLYPIKLVIMIIYTWLHIMHSHIYYIMPLLWALIPTHGLLDILE